MPLVYRKYTSNYVIGIWKITESLDQLLKEWKNKTPDEFDLVKNVFRKRQWLAARILAKRLAGISGISYAPSGKPFISGKNIYKSISISHSRRLLVIIAGKKMASGIDIEMIEPRIEKIAGKFINEQEKKMLTPDLALMQMYLIWCAKETLFKYYSPESFDFKNDFTVLPFPCMEKGSLSVLIKNHSPEKIKKLHYFFLKRSICVYTD